MLVSFKYNTTKDDIVVFIVYFLKTYLIVVRAKYYTPLSSIL